MTHRIVIRGPYPDAQGRDYYVSECIHCPESREIHTGWKQVVDWLSDHLDPSPRCIVCHKPLPPCYNCGGHQTCDPEFCSAECRVKEYQPNEREA